MKKWIHLPKISFPAIALCFLLPFVTIKCGNVELAKLNGVDLALGTTIEADEEVETVNPNIYIAVSFLTAVAGFVLAFFKRREMAVAGLILSVVGLVALVVFNFDVNSDIPGKGKYVLVISFGIGYYLAALGFLINSVFYGYSLSRKETENVSSFGNDASGEMPT